jgi:hypothetical protein
MFLKCLHILNLLRSFKIKIYLLLDHSSYSYFQCPLLGSLVIRLLLQSLGIAAPLGLRVVRQLWH